MHHGAILRLHRSGEFGWIAIVGKPDLWFHTSELRELEANEQLIGRRVLVEIQDSPKGPRAANVRAAKD